jgi:lipopolysaccharide/colanic/teichoic acid biosynthesis glycosyltransferase
MLLPENSATMLAPAVSAARPGIYARRLKPWFDLALTLLALPLILPVALLIAALIKLDSRGPALIKVRRLGRNHTTFSKYKFRTMVVDAERVLQDLLASEPEIRREYEATYKIKNDPRVTRFGRFLRKTSLDELAQVLNIVRGEMSWVGPRDILPKELAMYGDYGEKFVTVRPGITGLWQVSGRSRLPYSERVRLDMHYVDHLSLWLDLKILLKAVPVVLFGDGAL